MDTLRNVLSVIVALFGSAGLFLPQRHGYLGTFGKAWHYATSLGWLLGGIGAFVLKSWWPLAIPIVLSPLKGYWPRLRHPLIALADRGRTRALGLAFIHEMTSRSEPANAGSPETVAQALKSVVAARYSGPADDEQALALFGGIDSGEIAIIHALVVWTFIVDGKLSPLAEPQTVGAWKRFVFEELAQIGL